MLHLGSMVSTEGKGSSDRRSSGTAKTSSAFTAMVDTGTNVLSFAWVGDKDVFALLHPPEFEKMENGEVKLASPSPMEPTGKKSLGKGIKSKFKSKVLSPQDTHSNKDDDEVNPITDPWKFQPRVELKVLIGTNADAAEISGSIAAATATILGNISLRGGNRHPPTALFGGPVLCVGSLSKNHEGGTSDGMAYFYSKRLTAEKEDKRASTYGAVGPPLPYPDMVVWDDDGRLCVIIVGRRVAIYLSDPPNFTLLGTAPLGTLTEPDPTVESAKFVHGVLFFTTRTAVQCVFLGETDPDREDADRVCRVDSYVIASTEVPPLLSSSFSLAPVPLPMRLNRPSVLAYHGGSLLISSACGLHAVPLCHPLLRIGSLLAAGQSSLAARWFKIIPEAHHEGLASFLDRRDAPELAVRLPGLSLESAVDLCLRHDMTERLEELIEEWGLDGLRQIDGGGFAQSLSVCVGAHLLRHGKFKLVRQLAEECLSLGEEGREEAFVLANLLLVRDPSAQAIVEEAVATPQIRRPRRGESLDDPSVVASFVREHLLQ